MAVFRTARIRLCAMANISVSAPFWQRVNTTRRSLLNRPVPYGRPTPFCRGVSFPNTDSIFATFDTISWPNRSPGPGSHCAGPLKLFTKLHELLFSQSLWSILSLFATSHHFLFIHHILKRNKGMLELLLREIVPIFMNNNVGLSFGGVCRRSGEVICM